MSEPLVDLRGSTEWKKVLFPVHYSMKINGELHEDMEKIWMDEGSTHEDIVQTLQLVADSTEGIEIFDIQYYDGKEQIFLEGIVKSKPKS